MQVYRKEGALKVAYPLECRNISKVIRVEVHISVSINLITQKTKTIKTKTFFYLHKIFTQNLRTLNIIRRKITKN